MDSRGFPADLAVVPLFTVGEVFLIGAFDLLHGTNIWSERQKTQRDMSLHGVADKRESENIPT